MASEDIAEYAKRLIQLYGWVKASSIAECEARSHSPTGNLDGFWTAVLAEINAYGR